MLQVRVRNSGMLYPVQVNESVLLEIAWTVLPMVLLAGICLPSFKILKYQMLQKEKSFTTIRVTAYQWYWKYEYDFNGKRLSYVSSMLKASQRRTFKKCNTRIYPRLLAADFELVIPARKVVRLLITSADVIHSFAVPSFGVKTDAIPGKMNDTWVKVYQPGVYYGQCSEFCGKDHAFMPIAVRAVSQQVFRKWIELAESDLSGAFEYARLHGKATA
ncbi:MAG: cytochrome c oxidase subunit II [Candidatus Hodgkinia cicadicola]